MGDDISDMNRKRPATGHDSDEHPRDADVDPSIDHGRRPRPVIRRASRFPPGSGGPLRRKNWRVPPRPGIQAGVSPRPGSLPPGPAPKRPGEARPQIEPLNPATGAPFTIWSPSAWDQIRPVIGPAPRFPPWFGGPLRPENWQAAPRPGIQAGVPPRPGIQAAVSPRPRSLPPGPAPKRPGEARPQIEPLNPATGAPFTIWSPSAWDQIRPVIGPAPRFPPRFGGLLRPENWQAAPRPGIQAEVPPRPGIQAGVSPRPGSLPPGPAPERPGEARPQIEPINPETGAPFTIWSPSAWDQIRPVIGPVPGFPPRFGSPLRPENWQAARRPGIQAGVPPRPGIQAGVSPRPGSVPPGPAPERPGEARPQFERLYPATGAPCTFWSPSARDQIRPWRIIVPVPLLGPPEPKGDHEQAAHAPVSEEEEALLQEGGLVAAERSVAIIAELGGDDHDHNALDGHNNAGNQDQLEIIEEGAEMDGSTAQVKNDETPAVEMMDDMDAIVAFQKGLEDFWDAVLHVDDQAGDDGNVEVSNIDGEAHAQPVLAQLGDVNIGDQGDANVELMIKDNHHELPSDNVANVVVDNDSGGILRGADRGDHQEAGDVIAAHDYAAVEVVKDDETVVLREQSEPVGDQQAAGDVHGGDGTIAEQPAVNVDGAGAGDGPPMHNGDQGADVADVVEVVNEEDDAFPPLGQQPQQQLLGQADASSSTSDENRAPNDLIGIVLHAFKKKRREQEKGQ